MKIRYLGHACFEIMSTKGIKIITDPYTGVGYELPANLTADIVTVSHAHFDHNYTQAVQSSFVIDGLGEYSFGDVGICGISSYHDSEMGALRGENIIYKIKIDEITLCHMGDIGDECSTELVERIGEVDVLFIPGGGKYTVDARGAKRDIEAIQPTVVIPMHYRPDDGVLDIATEDAFLKLYPIGEVEIVQEGVLKFCEDTQRVIFLERVKTNE